eukprot:UN24301
MSVVRNQEYDISNVAGVMEKITPEKDIQDVVSKIKSKNKNIPSSLPPIPITIGMAQISDVRQVSPPEHSKSSSLPMFTPPQSPKTSIHSLPSSSNKYSQNNKKSEP